MEPQPAFSPKPEPSREQYKSLSESALDLPKRRSDDDLEHELLASDFANSGAEDFFAQLGFRKFAAIARGSTGFVFETTQNQIIRFQYTGDDKAKYNRPPIYEVLQTITSNYIGDEIVYAILPKVLPTNNYLLTNDFIRHLESKNYSVGHCDALRNDAGHLPDGTMIGIGKDVIDPPEVIKLVEADKAWLVESDRPSIFLYLHGKGYISKQEHFFPALMDGHPRGVLCDDDIERLRGGELETLRGEKPECFEGINSTNLDAFIGLVKDEGWYPSQAQEIMRERGTLAKDIFFADR